MFLAVVRDAWRQYRRRPLAAVVAVVVGGLPVFLDPDDALLAVPLVGVVVFPVATAAGTLLARQLLDEPT